MAIERSGNCWHCGTEIGPLEYGRQHSCTKCGRSTRACLNCEHHERSSHNECRESAAERVVDKEKGNFCDYFRPKMQAGSGAATKASLQAAAEALFKKKP